MASRDFKYNSIDRFYDKISFRLSSFGLSTVFHFSLHLKALELKPYILKSKTF